MASSAATQEFNSSTPGTETTATNMNWKNIDDSTTTAYTAAPITAGTNSFSKYRAIKFTGSFNSLSALSAKIDANSGTGLSWVAEPLASYAVPSIVATGASAFSTVAVSLALGVSASGASAVSMASNAAVYSQYLRTQLQTTSSAAPGDTATRTITYTWTES